MPNFAIGSLVTDKASLENLRYIANGVAAGNINAAESLGISAVSACDALAHGTGWVMVYGGACAFIFGLLALVIFGKQRNSGGEKDSLSTT